MATEVNPDQLMSELEQLKKINGDQDQAIKSLQQQVNQLRLEIGSLRKKVFP